MSDNFPGKSATTQVSGEDANSALFASMVVQQSNLALMMLGQVPHPETGERVRNLDAARMFIDQLAMLEAKTKGNLNARESGLLEESLTALRMAYVQAIESEPAPDSKTEPSRPSAAPVPPAEAGSSPSPEAATPPAEEESRKKFTKKY